MRIRPQIRISQNDFRNTLYYAKSLKITLTEHQDLFTHRKNGKGDVIPHIYHQFTYQKLGRLVTSSTPASLLDPGGAQDPRGSSEIAALTIPAQGRKTVFTAQGKGILTDLILDWGKTGSDAMRLRIIADQKERVNLLVSEFWGFSRQQRPQAKFQSALLQVDNAGKYRCYWPMPHRESLRIEMENPGPAADLTISTRHQNNWPQPEHFYFNAARMTDKTEPGRDIKLLETSGRGHYVGCILELANKTLEGDDRFYVDGEPFPPSWHGTGTEDYFRCGWYFHGGPLTRPWYGLLDNGTPKIAYRFHLADRVNFTKSVVIGFEHGHKNDYLGPYHGTVFWYSEK
jgi:hypothetical protein